ncbi:Uncharacterized protein APZ42_006924, partial [Daphnia magna]
REREASVIALRLDTAAPALTSSCKTVDLGHPPTVIVKPFTIVICSQKEIETGPMNRSPKTA